MKQSFITMKKDGKLCIEYPLLLLVFGFMISAVINPNLVLYKTCTVTLDFNENECYRLIVLNLTANSTNGLEEIVQTHATYIISSMSVIESLLSAVFCMFFGPWSDKYGRKPLIIMSLSAIVVADILKIFVTLIPTASPWLLVLCSLIAVSAGGFSTFYSTLICYIADTTTKKNRGFRMGIIDAFLSFGFLAGTLSSSYLFNAINFFGVYVFSTACLTLSILHIFFFVPESIESSSHTSFKTKIRDLFRFEHVAVMMKTTFKRRKENARVILLSILIISWLNMLNNSADHNVLYLYVRAKFHWNLEHFTFYSAGRAICLILGSIIGIYVLHKLLRVSEVPLIIFGFVSLIISLLMQGLAYKDWHLYLAGAIRSMSSVLNPMIRSLVSKLVQTEELGKVFAFIIASESFVTLLAAPFYTFLYNSTIKINPGAFNFVTAGVNVINVSFAVAVMFLQKRQQKPKQKIEKDTKT